MQLSKITTHGRKMPEKQDLRLEGWEDWCNTGRIS